MDLESRFSIEKTNGPKLKMDSPHPRAKMSTNKHEWMASIHQKLCGFLIPTALTNDLTMSCQRQRGGQPSHCLPDTCLVKYVRPIYKTFAPPLQIGPNYLIVDS